MVDRSPPPFLALSNAWLTHEGQTIRRPDHAQHGGYRSQLHDHVQFNTGPQHLASAELAAVASILGRLPTPAEYLERASGLEGKSDEVYRS